MAATLKEWKNSKFGWPEATTRSPHWEEPRQKVVTCCRYYNTVSHLHFFPWLWTEKLFIVTSDGRTIVGTLLGNDQVQNLILNDAVERVYSDDADVEEVPLGLYLIRGDNLCLVGEYDAEKLKDDERVSEPIKPVLQQIYFWEHPCRTTTISTMGIRKNTNAVIYYIICMLNAKFVTTCMRQCI